MWAQQGEGRDRLGAGEGPRGVRWAPAALGRRTGCVLSRQEQSWIDALVRLKATVRAHLGSKKKKKPEWGREADGGFSLWTEKDPVITLALGLLDPSTPSPQSHPCAACQESLPTRRVTRPPHLLVVYASHHLGTGEKR